jgi:transcriptional regulator with XRE-family HTH domain/tetratricopeptide (TPR) repeat protein
MAEVSFGNWIKRRRKSLDLTREALAGLVGCSISAIAKIESDERRPSRQIAGLLAEHLRIPPDQQALFLRVARRERMVERLGAPIRLVEPLPPPLADLEAASEQSLSIPLVGRDEENDRLVEVYRRASQGQACVVCLTGGAGMGKTRLALSFLERARKSDPPAEILLGRAFEVGGRLPYQPLVDALRAWAGHGLAFEEYLSDPWISELSLLLPELQERFPGLPPPMTGDPEFARAHLFEAVARLSLSLASHRPQVLFIDDLHWAEAGTRDLLHYLAHRWEEAGAPAMLLLTVRLEDVMANQALRDWLSGLERDIPMTRLELAPLSGPDLHELARALDEGGAQEPVLDELGAWLLAETGGSPFFVAQMLQMLQERDILVGDFLNGESLAIDIPETLQRLQSAGRLPLPPNVRGVILARLAHLSEKASALLLAAAVIGRQCSYERLCQVARLDEFNSLSALEELLNSRLLLEVGDEARPYTYAHDNIRDVVYTEAGTARRQVFHRQAFFTLEEGSAPPAELAFHAAAAHLYGPAFRYALEAGDSAMSLHAHAEALAHYKTALDFLDRGGADQTTLVRLCSAYGRAMELSSQYPAAMEHYEAMAQRARETGDRALELAALVGQCAIRATANLLSDYPLAEKLAQQGLSLALELGDKAAEARIQWTLLNVYLLTYRNELALAAGERSMALAQELGWREGMAQVANDLVYVYTVAGDFSKTLEMAQIATALWRELGNQPMLTDSLSSYSLTLAKIGEFDAALGIAEESLGIGRLLKNLWGQAYSLHGHSLVHWRRMEVDRALAVMDEAIRLSQEAGAMAITANIRTMQSQLRLALGDSTGALQLAEAAREIAAQSAPLFYPMAAGTLALIALAQGDPEKASVLLESIPSRKEYDGVNMFTVEIGLCQLALSKEQYDKALSLAKKELAFLKKENLRMFLPDFLYFQGQAYAGLGDSVQAVQALEEAVAVLEETGSCWRLWEIASILAKLARERGDTAGARRWQAMAASTVNKIVGRMCDPGLRAGFLELLGGQVTERKISERLNSPSSSTDG